MKNYYFFLTARAAVAEGWDNAEGGAIPGIGEAKRPWVWIRGGSPGMQRYATHWTGDIDFTEPFYHGSIVGMQASGLAGFPFYNHDAGGFGTNNSSSDPAAKIPGPNDAYYAEWAMGVGSFSPIWRLHGYNDARWPLHRNTASQDSFRLYGNMRYEMMPYIYGIAHEAHESGLPMSRTMALVYLDKPDAWLPAQELQYHWGDAFLVVPPLNLDGVSESRTAWIPPAAKWYDYWTDFPVYSGASGAYELVEDDGVTGLVAAPIGTPFLVVGRFTLSTTANSDTLDVWVNPTSAPTSNSTLRLTGFTGPRTPATSAGNLLLYSGYSAQSATDEIALGTTYADVTANLNTTPFESWMNANHPQLAGNDAIPGSDPDGDGLNNLGEFAFATDPASGASDGGLAGKFGDVNGSQVFTFTLPARSGAVFTNGAPATSAAIDGLIYQVQSGATLGAWTIPVETITGPAATVIQSTLPAPPPGWCYHTFRLDLPPGSARAFVRARVSGAGE